MKSWAEVPLCEQVAIGMVSRLAALKFFPGDMSARAEIVDLLLGLCETEDRAGWLIKRMLTIYDEWPGPREMRACYCSRYKPKDGLDVRGSRLFEEWPADPEAERAMKKLEAAPLLKALARGENPTGDPEFPARFAKAMDEIPPPKPPRRAAEEPTNPNFKPVTQADIDKAVEELHRQKNATG